MKIVKSISLFFMIAFLLIGFGIFLGVELNDRMEAGKLPPLLSQLLPGGTFREETDEHGNISKEKSLVLIDDSSTEQIQPVAEQQITLNADTELVIVERDVLRGTELETVAHLPEKYLGMNRERFETAMEVYESAPPLAEKERGFQGLEISSFSKERVVVQMNYEYVQPGTCFYLAVMNHEIVVLLEDKETIYMNTGILLEQIPLELQMEIINMKYIENEEALYALLENFSS